MSPLLAFAVITWAAIVLLFLGLGAVLRELRMLRMEVARDPSGFTAAQPDIRLDGWSAAGAQPELVLAVDSGCALCRTTAERLASRRPGSVLLTHESPEVWAEVADRLRVLSDRTAWRAISHLSPPVLMLIDGTGSVRRMVLPTTEDDVTNALIEWTGSYAKGGS